MAVQKSPTGKKTNWKLILILSGIVIIAAGFFLITMNVITSRASNKYEEVLANYYKARADENTNAILLLITRNFEDDLSTVNFKGAGYTLYAYDFSEDEKTNDMPQSKKLTFSVTMTENNNPVSYLCEAFFVTEDGAIKLFFIRKIYKGKNITRMAPKRLPKV